MGVGVGEGVEATAGSPSESVSSLLVTNASKIEGMTWWAPLMIPATISVLSSITAAYSTMLCPACIRGFFAFIPAITLHTYTI